MRHEEHVAVAEAAADVVDDGEGAGGDGEAALAARRRREAGVLW